MKYGFALVLIGLGLIALPVLLYATTVLLCMLVILLGNAALPVVLTVLALLTGVWIRRGVLRLKRRRVLVQAKKRTSPEIAALILELRGAYPPYIIEAAEQLGKARDRTAVPALLDVLEQVAENQRPGWRDVAAALADALAEIGDGRALPLLYRLENVRGIGFIPNVRNAIAVIEPQAVLLRAGSADDAIQSAMLLRPAYGAGESDKALLLRAAEADAS